MKKITELHTIWNELVLPFNQNQDLIDDSFQRIITAYTSKNRFYHSVDHIYDMLIETRSIRSKINDIAAFQFAIFYHDIIYDATRQDNEQKSADLAQSRMKNLGVPSPIIERCHQHILATKTHISSGDKDTDLLLDIDLAILGQPYEVYEQYTKNVRNEYKMYPDGLYNNGRKKVIKHFLKMAPIYKTTFFQQKYEDQAKKNLTEELKHYNNTLFSWVSNLFHIS